MALLDFRSENFFTSGADGNLLFSANGNYLFAPFYTKFCALKIIKDTLSQVAEAQPNPGGTNKVYQCAVKDDLIYVAANYFAWKLNVYAFDGANFTRLAYETPHTAYAIYLDSEYIYCGDSIFRFNGLAFEVKTICTTFQTNKPYYFASDGTYVYVYTSTGKLYATTFNGSTYTLVANTTLANHGSGQICCANGKIYFAANAGNIQIYTFDGVIFTLETTYAVGDPSDSGYNICVDNGYIFYTTYLGFYLVKENSGEVLQFIPYSNGYDTGFNFSGSFVHNGYLYLMKSYRNITYKGVSGYYSSIQVYKINVPVTLIKNEQLPMMQQLLPSGIAFNKIGDGSESIMHHDYKLPEPQKNIAPAHSAIGDYEPQNYLTILQQLLPFGTAFNKVQSALVVGDYYQDSFDSAELWEDSFEGELIQDTGAI